MNRLNAARLPVLVLAASLAGCATLEDMFSGDRVDYKSSVSQARGKGLEIPPDLTQLARDSRYQPQGGVVSAAAGPAATVAPAATATQVALQVRGDIRVERDGTQRWLVVPASPDALWPQVRAFWLERGFTLASENAEAGLMETDWAENRSRLPVDFIRGTIGKLLGSVYDTGERDRFRTRIERTPAGSEIYISHRGMEEVFVGERRESTQWRQRPSDPQLEAEMLSRLMTKLGPKEDVARVAVANAPEAAPRARAVADTPGTLEVDEPFDRAWRRVGVALDRSGFTVEDRDRAGGLYFVRYVDPKYAGQDDDNWFTKWFRSGVSRKPERYRVNVKADGSSKSVVSVTAGNGTDAAGEAGKRIVATLVNELR